MLKSLHSTPDRETGQSETAWMRRTAILLLVLAITVAAASPGFAFRKTGTTAAAFLLIPVGSRLPAMGGAGVALQSTPDALAYNPAAAWSDNLGLNATHTDWFAGLRHQSIAVVVPYGDGYALGLNIISFSGDSFEQTTLTEQEGTGVMVEYGDLSVGLSGIARLTDRFTVGVSGKYIYQKLFHLTASTFAFDVGTHLETDLPGFTIGMAMTNLGGEMRLEGRDLYLEDAVGTQYETGRWPLPLTFQTGIGWRLFGTEKAMWRSDQHAFLIAADADHLNEGTTTLHFGAEYSLAGAIFLRSGYIAGHDTKSWTFGAGVKVRLYSYIVQADYALADLEDLGGIQRVSLTLLRRSR